jgi:DNA-binding MarR family transcriptional regulator
MVRSRRHTAADAWGSLLRAHARLLPAMDAGVRRTGISLAYYDVLLELSAEPEGRLRMSDLGERVVLSRTRVSRLVDEMVRAGLVAREANTDDRRSAFAVITEAGRESFRAAAPRYLDLIEEQVAPGLTSAELATLARLLDRLGTEPDPAGLHEQGGP